MERIEKILKKLEKDIEDEEIQRYKDCINSKLDAYLTDVNDQYLNAQARFETRLNFLQSESIESVISNMLQDLDEMENNQTAMQYINRIRSYIFENVKSTKSVKGFKQ